MQPSFYPMQQKTKATPLRTALRQASDRLGQGKALFDLTMGAVLCLLVTIALYMLFEMLYAILTVHTALSAPLIAAVLAGVLLAMFVLLVLPFFVGRLRLAGLYARGEEPMLKEIFYVFTSPAHYARGLALSLVYLFSFLIPIGICAGACFGTHLLYTHVLYVYLQEIAANLLAIVLYLCSIALLAPGLLISVFYFSTTALLVGKSTFDLKGALARSVRIGKKNMKVVYAFLWRTLLYLLLSLCTLGVLWILFYAHQTTLAYWELVMLLDGELETEKSEIGGHYEGIC